MTEIRFTCACGLTLKAYGDQIGSSVCCPSCQSMVTVPAAGMGSMASPEAEGAGEDGSVSGHALGFALIYLSAIGLLTAGAVVFFLLPALNRPKVIARHSVAEDGTTKESGSGKRPKVAPDLARSTPSPTAEGTDPESREASAAADPTIPSETEVASPGAGPAPDPIPIPPATPAVPKVAVARPGPTPPEEPRVNDTVTVRPVLIATDLPTLRQLTRTPTGPGASGPGPSRVRALTDQGKLIELKAPTRAVIQAVIRDNSLDDPPTGRMTLVYQARLLDGPSTTRMAFLLATQFLITPDPRTRPSPADRPEDLETEIYRVARAALSGARARAAQVDLSVRKAATRREIDAARMAVCKKFDLSPAALDAIMRRGEERDGTAQRKAAAANPARAALRASNQAALGALDRQINAGLNNAIRNSGGPAHPRLPGPNLTPFR